MCARSQVGHSKGPALARRLIAILVLTTMVLPLLPVLPASADTVTTFSDSTSVTTLVFSSAGNKSAYVLVPDDATVTKAVLDMAGQEVSNGQGFPTNLTLDVGADTTIDWGFKGLGVGSFGHQSMLENGSLSGAVNFKTHLGGTDTSLSITLPKFAQIKDGNMIVSGTGNAVQPVLGTVLKGSTANEEFGYTGANVGDVDNDGNDDMVISSGYTDTAYLFLGGPKYTGTPFLTMYGQPKSYFGSRVSGLGDVNNDGIDDFAVTENGTLSVRVFFGGPTLDEVPDLNLTGVPALFTYYGCAVAGGSDLDGDGYNDIAVGDYYYDTTDRGRVYVYKGGPALDNVSDYILEISQWMPLGYTLAMGGDLTGDGIDDLAVGDPDLGGFSMGGKVYIYKGGPGFGSGPLTMAMSPIYDDLFAWDLDISHDVNGDGIDDLVIGAPENGTGKVYIYWGRTSWPGFVGPSVIIQGESSGDYFGYSVATLGDLSGDTRSELLVGAPGYGGGKFMGRAYYINGSASPVRKGSYEIPGTQVNSYTGWWVEYLGPITKNGKNDFAISELGNNSAKGDVLLYRPSYGLGTPSVGLGGVTASGLSVACLNGSKTVTFSATDLQTALNMAPLTTTDIYGNQFAKLTFSLSAASKGTMSISGLSINYSAHTAATLDLKIDFNHYLSEKMGFNATGEKVPVPLVFHSSSPGRLVLSALRVEYKANKPPVAYIDEAPQVVDTGQYFTLKGHATDDGTIYFYEWKSNMDGILGHTAELKINLTYLGTHNITFRAQDSNLRWSEPVSVTVLVRPVNNIPQDFIDAPLEGDKVAHFVNVTGHFMDPDIYDTFVPEISIDGKGWQDVQMDYSLQDHTTYWYFIWDTSNETDGPHTIRARVNDTRDFSPEAVVNVTVTHPMPEILMFAPPTTTAYPGDKVTLQFSLKNTGTGPGTFRLKTRSNLARIEPINPVLWLNASDKAFVNLSVQIDKTTKVPYDIEVGLKAVLTDDISITDERVVIIHVVSKLPDPALQSVSIDYPSDGKGKAGMTVSYVFKVRNGGTILDTYDISVTSKDGWVATMTIGGSSVTGPVPIDKGATTEVTVFLQIPKNAKGGAFSELTFSVRSQNFPLVNGSGTIKTKVQSTPVKTSVISLPYVQVALVTTVLVVCALGIVIGGTEWGTFGLFWLFIPMYSRLKKEAVLDNFKRGEINAFIRLNPGTYYNEIKKHLDVSNGVLTYHLNRLEIEGFVRSKVNGRYKHYFPADMKIPMRIVTLNDLQRALLKFIRDKKWVTQSEISEQLDIPVPTVSRHLKRLIDAEMVVSEKRGNLNYYAIHGEWAGKTQSDQPEVDTYDVGGNPQQVYQGPDQNGYYQGSDAPPSYRASEYQQFEDQPPDYKQ